MKFLYAVIAVAVIWGGYNLLAGDTVEAPAVDPMMTEEDQEDTTDHMPGRDSEEVWEEEEEMFEMDDGEGAEKMEEMSGSEKIFTLDSFSFGYSETEIKVKKGDTVTINLTNSAGFHDWVVDEFGAATDKIKEGETTSVTFVADAAGEFEYYCSVGSHRASGMVGTLIVE